MLNRRDFLGALTALVAAPRALFARQPLTTLGLSESLTGTYRYRVTYYAAGGREVPAQAMSTWTVPSPSRCYRVNPDGSQTFLPNGIDDGRP